MLFTITVWIIIVTLLGVLAVCALRLCEVGRGDDDDKYGEMPPRSSGTNHYEPLKRQMKDVAAGQAVDGGGGGGVGVKQPSSNSRDVLSEAKAAEAGVLDEKKPLNTQQESDDLQEVAVDANAQRPQHQHQLQLQRQPDEPSGVGFGVGSGSGTGTAGTNVASEKSAGSDVITPAFPAENQASTLRATSKEKNTSILPALTVAAVVIGRGIAHTTTTTTSPPPPELPKTHPIDAPLVFDSKKTLNHDDDNDDDDDDHHNNDHNVNDVPLPYAESTTPNEESAAHSSNLIEA